MVFHRHATPYEMQSPAAASSHASARLCTASALYITSNGLSKYVENAREIIDNFIDLWYSGSVDGEGRKNAVRRTSVLRMSLWSSVKSITLAEQIKRSEPVYGCAFNHSVADQTLFPAFVEVSP